MCILLIGIKIKQMFTIIYVCISNKENNSYGYNVMKPQFSPIHFDCKPEDQNKLESYIIVPNVRQIKNE